MKSLLIYTSPFTMPFVMIPFLRGLVWLGGAEWTDPSFGVFIACFLGVSTGLVIILATTGPNS